MDPIYIFLTRLRKIGIEIWLSGNAPWIYLDRINGKKVTEKYLAEHGFTLAFYPLRREEKIQFTNITEIFKIIRKYR